MCDQVEQKIIIILVDGLHLTDYRSEASFGGGGLGAPKGKRKKKKERKKERKKIKEKAKRKKRKKKEGNYMNSVKLLHIKCYCSPIFQ